MEPERTITSKLELKERKDRFSTLFVNLFQLIRPKNVMLI